MVGSLLVTMARSPELLKTLVGAVQGWLSSQHSRSVELQIGGDTLKVGGLSAAEQGRLIDLFGRAARALRGSQPWSRAAAP